jgi:DNA-binding MarR family transcriptional regulator
MVTQPESRQPQEDVADALRAYWEAVAVGEPVLLALWRSSGITLNQMRILRLLAQQPVNAGDLARAVGMKAPSLTRLLDRLEERGFVTRGGDPSDRRRVLVTITERGHSFLAAPLAAASNPLPKVMKALTPEERELLTQALRTFVQRAHLVLAGEEGEGRPQDP